MTAPARPRPWVVARDCDHCERPIVLLPRVWGGERPITAYERAEVPIAEAAQYDRFAYSRSRRGVIQLDPDLPADDPGLPPTSLVQHRCGRDRRGQEFTRWLTGAVDQAAPGLGDPLVTWLRRSAGNDEEDPR